MRILITGATNGMGRGVAEALAASDDERNELILLCRSEERGKAAVKDLEARGARASLAVCDLADLSAVRRVAGELREAYGYLDAIFVNAGLGYAAGRTETVDGLDSHFQVNYLSQFYLTLGLIDLLRASERGGRVVFNATPGGRILWDDLQLTRSWSYETGIRQAMAAKRMLLLTLDERYGRGERPVSFICFSIPKTVWTNQVAIIPAPMRIAAGIMRALGRFISMERCGEIMAPLFLCGEGEIRSRSGRLLTWKGGRFVELPEDPAVIDGEARRRLYELSVGLCEGAGLRLGEWEGPRPAERPGP
ncbi:MAG: SDR family NAD(P)-dependent oxidoreductase [Spirochaetes bacterium]|nr:SDR family NAD(P)-dependent oxidoreductase [Spirochaetota bacterium]MBU1079198.1 SDR family NAD(P)-dependent oxidoreductase [Spirochaetota bacterium]